MRKTLLGIAPLMLLFTIISSTVLPQACARQTVVCPKLERDVTIDGKWTSAEEWTDASEFPLTFADGSGEAYFSMKHDSNNFYVLVDFVSRSKTEVGDSAIVALDTQNDGGNDIKDDDLAIMMRWNTPNASMGAMQWRGWGGQNWQPLPSGFGAKSSIEAQNDPHSTAPHEIYEFRIPKTTFKAPTSRFLVFIGDAEAGISYCGYFALYPMTDVSSPDNWTELQFSDKMLAELTAASTSSSTTSVSWTPPILTPSVTATASSTRAETVTVTTVGQMPGGYITIVGIVIVAIVAAVLLLRKRK